MDGTHSLAIDPTYWRFANPEKGHHDLTQFAAQLADDVLSRPERRPDE